MKRIFSFIFMFCAMFMFIACTAQQPQPMVQCQVTNDSVYYIPGYGKLTVVEIDGCEYLIGRKCAGDFGFGYLSHKGNCKYCAERRKQEMYYGKR